MTKEITIGNVRIGGGNPIAIQTMTNTHTTDIDATLRQINQVHQAGCDIIRVAIPNVLSANALKDITSASPLPVVADIHFDSKLALLSIKNGASKIRINPGNIEKTNLTDIIACAKEYGVPIRIGVNSGSPNKEMLTKYGTKSVALAESLLSYLEFFENNDFDNLVLAIKSSDVKETIELNRYLHSRCDYPLHIGLTEAGVPQVGIVKNSIAIATLLQQGIGDTIRVSLTGDPLIEVETAKTILSSIGKRKGVEFVSCPKCGRCVIDLEGIANKVYDYVKGINKNIKIAVMGCEVNGPGECIDADLGLAGGKQISFFKHGKIFRTVEQEIALQEFLKEIDQL